MQFKGIIVGIVIFLIIGVFHPIVIKAEYFFTKRIWPVFLIAGLIFTLISLLCKNDMESILLGVLGFTCFWSINELFEQEERVKKVVSKEWEKKLNNCTFILKLIFL